MIRLAALILALWAFHTVVIATGGVHHAIDCLTLPQVITHG